MNIELRLYFNSDLYAVDLGKILNISGFV